MKNLKFILIFCLPFLSYSQMTEAEMTDFINNSTEQELLIECSSMTQEFYYYNAEKIIDKLLTIQPESSNYNYRKGFLVLNSRKDFETAIPYLEKAILDISKNFDMYSTKEQSAPPDAYYHLGTSYHLDEQLDKAKEHYQLFIDNSLKKSELIAVAELNKVQCDNAKREMANPKKVVIENLGDNVNTNAPEYSPTVSLDGTSLYFTSRRVWEDNSSDPFRDPKLNNYPEDIYVTHLSDEGVWSSPERLGFCNSELNEATISVSGDEKRIYVYQDIAGGGDIYYSDFANNEFEAIQELTYKDVNTKYWETHCTVTPDGQNMYFVSDRPGGYGGRDIYRIVKLPNGEWSEPQNLGPGINTPYDEESPFIAVDNKTLYFSSNGDKSIGDFDVFVTFRDDLNNWSEPVNMGYPINSTGSDIFYTTTFDGLRGYLTSFRKGGLGEKDIYEIKNDYLGTEGISTLKGKVFMTDGTELSEDISVKIECLNCGDEKLSYPRVKNGTYFTMLDRCKEYHVHFLDGNDVLATKSVVTNCASENDDFERNLAIGGYVLAGKLIDEKTGEPIAGVKVDIINTETNEIIESHTTDEQGKYTTSILKDKTYEDEVNFTLKTTSKDYMAFSEEHTITLGKNGQISISNELTPLEVGTDIGNTLAINPIYFDLNSSIIRPDAAKELDKIVQFMNDNPSIEIELGSHTDCRASEKYNQWLSNRRAVSSAKYIKSRIKNKNRISGKGYGESKLVNDCGCEGDVVSDCSEEEHQANRRTEFRIVKK